MKFFSPTLGLWFFLSTSIVIAGTPDIYNAQGELSGEATQSTVLLQSRLTAIPGPALDGNGDVPGAPGVACFEWSRSEGFADSQRTEWLKAVPESDFIVRARLENLEPGQRYFYRLIFGRDRDHTQTGPIREFKTLPSPSADEPLSFCMGSCMCYHFFMTGGYNDAPTTATDEDKRLGYPSFAAMSALQPDFFIGTGDIVYYDHPKKQPAKTLPELRKKWHEQFHFPRLVEFFAKTPAYWSKDDHDFRFNDSDPAGSKVPSPTTGIEIFREQMPIHPAGDHTTPTYRAYRVHKHLQLWLTEGRDYRSPNAMEDGPQKSIWGATQRDWLKRTLKESNATWKIIINPTPMVGPDSATKQDNHTNLGGFRHEADAFFQWLKSNNLTNVLIFCGDRHWQYHSIHPEGFEEFSVGALNDENSVKGYFPGQKNSTDPEARIQQPFHYTELTGGFLHVTVGADSNEEARLQIEFRDDHGAVLYSVEKTGSTN